MYKLSAHSSPSFSAPRRGSPSMYSLRNSGTPSASPLGSQARSLGAGRLWDSITRSAVASFAEHPSPNRKTTRSAACESRSSPPRRLARTLAKLDGLEERRRSSERLGQPALERKPVDAQPVKHGRCLLTHRRHRSSPPPSLNATPVRRPGAPRSQSCRRARRRAAAPVASDAQIVDQAGRPIFLDEGIARAETDDLAPPAIARKHRSVSNFSSS